MAFGLGAGASFFYVAIDGQSPSRFTNGRAARLEENFLELTGTPLRLRTEPDPERSWELARERRRRRPPGSAADRPLLPRPLRQLRPLPGPRRGARRLRRLRRPALGHRLRGAADDRPPQPGQGKALQAADLPARGPRRRPARGSGARRRRACARPSRPRSRARRERCSSRRSATTRGSRRSSASPTRSPRWPEAAEDWQWCARFLFQVIERRGTGGGNFRAMYSRFLEEAGYEQAPLCAEAARLWTEPRRTPRGRRARRDEPDAEHVERSSGAEAARVRDAEGELWRALAA